VEAAGTYRFLGRGIQGCYDKARKQEFWR